MTLLITAACSSPAPASPDAVMPSPSLLDTLPPAPDPASPVAPASSPDAVAAPNPPSFVVADVDGHVGVIAPDGAATLLRDGSWDTTVSLDGSYGVATAPAGDGDTEIAWDALPSAEVLASAVVIGDELEVAATQVGGHLVALVNPAEAPVDGVIAGGRDSSVIVLAGPERGEIARFELDGNFVPEALGSTRGAGGLPAQVFLLEYLPAEAPTRYRVRVLDTATGALAMPLNLRAKTGPPVDQEMAGVTRGQLLADEHGLLFTLYRGTSDMPGGHPYAFVHTLDLYDGVWCLDVPDEMRLEELPGALAVAGDRLYVASANGTVGAYDISAIREPQGSVDMLWVATFPTAGGRGRPAIGAGPDGAVVAFPSMSGLHHVGTDGTVLTSSVFDDGTEAIAIAGGVTYVAGDAWTLPGERPEWLGEIARLVAVS